MLFFRYLKQKWRTLVVCAIFALLLLVSFILYRLPLGAVLYPTVLCLCIGLLSLILEYARVSSRHKRLRHVLDMCRNGLIPEELPEPETVEEADLHAILTALREEQTRLRMESEQKYEDTVAYYTAWAHQIKTPIASMRLHLQGEDTPLSRRLTGDLLRIEQYADMVLTYIRLDAESTDYVFRPCALDELIRTSVKRFSGEFIGRHLTLTYEPTDARIVTDRKWLSFVIDQVLSNALKYTREGGITVTVTQTARADGHTAVLLEIADTGIGIVPEDLPRIFEEGFTGMNGRTDRRSSGIGLYLCRRVCQALGIVLSATSAVDVGTTVRLLFDVSDERIE